MEPLREEMIALARGACAGIDAGAYCATRFDRYPSVLWSRDATGRLDAFLLYERFEEDGATFLYLGPLFSRGGAFLPMFVAEVRRLLATERGPIHWLCEAQNPAIVHAFRALFPFDVHPRRTRLYVSLEARRTVARFARRIPHIGPVDYSTFTTAGSESLFRPGTRSSLVRTIRGRTVDLAGGRSLLLLASCGASRLARARIELGITLGVAALEAHRRARAA